MTPADQTYPSTPSRPRRFTALIKGLSAPARRLASRHVNRRTALITAAVALAAIFTLPLLLQQSGALRSVPVAPPLDHRSRPDDVVTLPGFAPGESTMEQFREAQQKYRDAQEAYQRAATEGRRQVGAAGSGPLDAPWARRVIRRASLEVEAPDVEQSLTRLTEIIESAGGYVAGTEAQTDGSGTVRARVTVYVPPDRFGRTLAELSTIGRVTQRRMSGEDVSEEFVDLEARIRNFERHETQLQSFMSRAQKVSDLLSLEHELARVRGEIERLRGRLRFLVARTEMATIQVSLARALMPAPTDDGLVRVWGELTRAFREAWLAAFRTAAQLAVLAARLSPLAVLLVGAWLAYRVWSRRRPVATPATL